MAVTDDDLVGKALGGAQGAYAALVDRYQRPVFSLIVRLMGDPAVAAELAQDTFLKAFRRLESFDRQWGFSPWLLPTIRPWTRCVVAALRPPSSKKTRRATGRASPLVRLGRTAKWRIG